MGKRPDSDLFLGSTIEHEGRLYNYTNCTKIQFGLDSHLGQHANLIEKVDQRDDYRKFLISLKAARDPNTYSKLFADLFGNVFIDPEQTILNSYPDDWTKVDTPKRKVLLEYLGYFENYGICAQIDIRGKTPVDIAQEGKVRKQFYIFLVFVLEIS